MSGSGQERAFKLPMHTGTKRPGMHVELAALNLKTIEATDLDAPGHLMSWKCQLLNRPKAIRLYRFSNASVPPSITRQTASRIA